MKLKGKTALVTGAAKRIGRRFALGLARRGRTLYVHYNSSAADARRAVAEIKTLGVDAIAVKAINPMHAKSARPSARLSNISTTSTSLSRARPVYKKTPFDTLARLTGFSHRRESQRPFLFALEVGRHMKARGLSGKIVTFSDWAASRMPVICHTVFPGGIICLTKSWRKRSARMSRSTPFAPGLCFFPPISPSRNSGRDRCHRRETPWLTKDIVKLRPLPH